MSDFFIWNKSKHFTTKQQCSEQIKHFRYAAYFVKQCVK